MTLSQIKSELAVKTALEFFTVLDADKNPTEWLRAKTLGNDFIVVHKDTFEEIKKNPAMSGLFLKRKSDIIFHNEEKGTFETCRSFVLCKSEAVPVGEL